ncbi:hypothetical protein HMPREF1279_00402 [Propionibacterium sp. KPL1852]|nr:Alpha-acetolactate decarboxylase [Cutibacterium avidum TM16]ERS39371.1 hypothetical protein HMPREF1271_00880 [Propionibacterium sp. KPL1838]ERS69298.1 hypothetical protein HMPREF1279_00402 [Propionibacterium sp. KPL1852]
MFRVVVVCVGTNLRPRLPINTGFVHAEVALEGLAPQIAKTEHAEGEGASLAVISCQCETTHISPRSLGAGSSYSYYPE